MQVRVWFAVVSPVLALLAGPAGAVEWQGKIETVGGIPTYRNPSRPIDAPITMKAEPLWTLGTDEEAEGEFFGVVTSILEAADGTVYLLDSQLSEIKAFSADGAYLRTFGPEGECPVEFRRARDMVFLPNGNLGVAQPRPARLIALTPEGTPAQDFVPKGEDPNGMVMMRGAQRTGPGLVLEINRMVRSEGSLTRKVLLTAYDPAGNPGTTYFTHESSMDFANPVFREIDMAPTRVWRAGPDGRLYRAAADGSYAIHVHGPGGAVEKVYAVNKPPRARNADELKEARESMFFRGPVNPTVEASPNAPAIREIFYRPGDELWVMNGIDNYELPKGTAVIFDVINAKGEYVRRITVEGDFDIEGDLLVFGAERLYVVRRFRDAMAVLFGNGSESEADAEDAEPIEITAYRLVRKGV